MDPLMITALTGAATALGVREGIRWLTRWAAGASGREKSRFNELKAERTQAEERADREAELRRRAEENCSLLIRALIEAGVQVPRLSWSPPAGPEDVRG